MKTFISFSFLLFVFFSASAQIAPGEHVPGEIIVQLHQKKTIDNFVAGLKSNSLRSADIQISKSMTLSNNIHLVKIQTTEYADKELLNMVRAMPEVELAQLNYRVRSRSTNPNDALFVEQWAMDMINAPAIWDIVTGGETPLGDEIVIAVLDDGFDITHPDLIENIWHNDGEVAADGLDNDNNGFIDDYDGWNWDQQDDNHPKDNHGEIIAGIIGAEGNNENGVAGVNWNIKILLISGADFNNEIIEAYTYIRDLRRKYNDTNGKEGAFIVATNASFGIDFRFCEDLPVWGAMYDSLGVEGVLSLGATINSNVNVDVEGDMPTSCPSDYLITVTNTDQTDTKVTAAGYGAKHIDLGAPGQNIVSTKIDNDYGQSGDGTSFSTPHVAGAVGLLYSLPCTDIAELAHSNPGQAALLIKEFILNGTSANASLNGITLSGGRLDLEGSMNLVRAYCEGAVGELAFAEFSPNPTDGIINIKFQTPALANYTFRVFNPIGQLIYTERLDPADYFADTFSLDLSHLAAGVYIVSISTLSELVSHKFVVY